MTESTQTRFPMVGQGYDPQVVDVRIAEAEAELSQLRARLADAEQISGRGREIFLRALNKALVAAYEVVADTSREAEQYRREVEAEVAQMRAAAEQDLHRIRQEVAAHEAALREREKEVHEAAGGWAELEAARRQWEEEREKADAELERRRVAWIEEQRRHHDAEMQRLAQERARLQTEMRAEREGLEAELAQLREAVEATRKQVTEPIEEWKSAAELEIASARAAIEEERTQMLAAVRDELEAARAHMQRQLDEERAAIEKESAAAAVQEARAEADRILTEAQAEAERIRQEAHRAAAEHLEHVRKDWDRQLAEQRLSIAALVQQAESERDAYTELKRRLAERAATAAGVRRDRQADPAQDLDEDPGPLASEEAFKRFFEEEIEEEPSRAWILGDE